MILEGLYKSKFQESAQLQTVLALYDQEPVPNGGQPNYQRLKMCEKLHIDQTLRNKNFKIRNEVVEGGAVTESCIGKKTFVERKSGRMPSVESKWTRFRRRLKQFPPWASSWKPLSGPQVKRTIILFRTRCEGTDRRSDTLEEIQWHTENYVSLVVPSLLTGSSSLATPTSPTSSSQDSECSTMRPATTRSENVSEQAQGDLSPDPAKNSKTQ